MTAKAKLALGAKLRMGIVCVVRDDGALIGREAEPEESCPRGHTEYNFGKVRAFLSDAQSAIPLGLLR